MRKIFLSCLILITSYCYAAPNPDEVGVCYLFNKNKLKSTGTCVVSSGTGAGGGYTSLNYKGKKYLFEYATNDDGNFIEKNDSYVRNNFYDRLTQKQAEQLSDREMIYCFKHKPYDICYK